MENIVELLELKFINKKIKFWADKMNKAEGEGDMNTYNKCILKIQELEAQYEFILD